jgi:hypothetical protein
VAILNRYLGALGYLGATLQWRDGVVLHTEEVLDPQRLDPWIRRWAAQPGEIDPSLRRAPASALAMASGHLDFTAVLEVLRQLVSERQRTRLENLVLTLGGLLLGHDLAWEILPQLGPGVLAYIEAPDADRNASDARLAQVLVVGLGNATGLAPALENAFQTFLTAYALDPQHGDGQLQLESRDVSGRKVTALHPSTPLAFALDRNRLVLGSTPDAVERALLLPPPALVGNVPAGGAFERLRADHFPQAGSFVCVDMVRLHDYVLDRRGPLAARLAARHPGADARADRDLDQAIALMSLFRQAYFTTTAEADATAVHRTLGLLPREPATPAVRAAP